MKLYYYYCTTLHFSSWSRPIKADTVILFKEVY